MQGAVGALYEVLIERDLPSIPRAAAQFLERESAGSLWTAVSRFALLAFAPSLHSKRALVACRAAGELQDEYGARWSEILVECARYAAESRPPWSEPPPLDPPEIDASAATDDLAAVLASGDRLRAERWLAAHVDEAPSALLPAARGETLLLLDAALALEATLGAKGRFALLRTVVWDLVANPGETDPDLPVAELVARASSEQGSIESVSAVFAAEARRRMETRPAPSPQRAAPPHPAPVYRLARDFAQTLIARSVTRRLIPAEAELLLAAVDENLEHGESYADWSLA